MAAAVSVQQSLNQRGILQFASLCGGESLIAAKENGWRLRNVVSAERNLGKALVRRRAFFSEIDAGLFLEGRAWLSFRFFLLSILRKFSRRPL
jgi:Holliday junction resolvase